MSLNIQPTPATLGATLTGVNLAALTPGEWAAILAAFHEYAVLFFPAQHLSAAAQLAFAQRFGDIEILVEGLPNVPVQRRKATMKMQIRWPGIKTKRCCLTEQAFPRRICGNPPAWSRRSLNEGRSLPRNMNVCTLLFRGKFVNFGSKT